MNKITIYPSNFEFIATPEMDNESETAFAVMFFKESGKYLDTAYFTVNKPESASAYSFNDTITVFVENYDRYRNATAVVISGPSSNVIPQLISADRRY